MTKDQLKHYIKQLELDQEIENLVMELIDGAPDVNEDLLNVVADILDQQADFYEKYAEIMQEEADVYGQFAQDLQNLDDEEIAAKMEEMVASQDTLAKELQEKVEDIKANYQGNSVSVQSEAPQEQSPAQSSEPTV